MTKNESSKNKSLKPQTAKIHTKQHALPLTHTHTHREKFDRQSETVAEANDDRRRASPSYCKTSVQRAFNTVNQCFILLRINLIQWTLDG